MNLHEAVAILKDAKTRAERSRTALHHALQKPDLFAGFSSDWVPHAEEWQNHGQREVKMPQAQATDMLPEVRDIMSNLYDLECAKDTGNQTARADVVVDGEVLLSDVPVTFLMYLEKELVHLRTLVEKTPNPDAALQWARDENQGFLVSNEVRVSRTKKVPRSMKTVESTEHHPAQVHVYTEDVPIGWVVKKSFSGALPEVDKRRLLHRISVLRDAVKSARSQANETAVSVTKVGHKVFDWCFRGTALEQSSS